VSSDTSSSTAGIALGEIYRRDRQAVAGWGNQPTLGSFGVYHHRRLLWLLRRASHQDAAPTSAKGLNPGVA
jgi:hypothetical protein